MEEHGYQEANFGIDNSKDDLVFPSKPPIETTPEGDTIENRPGANDKKYASRTYLVSGKTILAVCRMIETGDDENAIATLSDLATIDLDAPVETGRVDLEFATVGDLVQARMGDTSGN